MDDITRAAFCIIISEQAEGRLFDWNRMQFKELD